jgi:hypothetical protein
MPDPPISGFLVGFVIDLCLYIADASEVKLLFTGVGVLSVRTNLRMMWRIFVACFGCFFPVNMLNRKNGPAYLVSFCVRYLY